MSKETTPKYTTRETYDFDYIFTEAEIKEKSQQLSRLCIEKTDIENRKKEVNSDFKAKIDTINSKVTSLSNHISTGKEYVSKTCDVVFDYEKQIKTYYFEGVKVGEAKMTKADNQLKIDIKKGEDEGTAAMKANTEFDSQGEDEDVF
jgi:hypothetical protein